MCVGADEQGLVLASVSVLARVCAGRRLQMTDSAGFQICSATIVIAPHGHSVAHIAQPLQ
jgi:hypothetical protein